MIDNLPDCLSISTIAVSATVIDFTLSRATVPSSTHSPIYGQVEALSGGFDDEWMFTGEGDYQYECYRIMKRLVQDKWEAYCPATNLVVRSFLSVQSSFPMLTYVVHSGCTTLSKSSYTTKVSRSRHSGPRLARRLSRQIYLERHYEVVHERALQPRRNLQDLPMLLIGQLKRSPTRPCYPPK